MESLASASLADNTHAAYNSACRSFLKFYASFTSSPVGLSLSNLPLSAASDPVLSAFAASLSDKGLAASTIEGYLAGIRTSFRLARPEIQLFNWKDSRTKRVCEGIARSFPERGRGRSNPLTVSIIRRAVALLQSEHQQFSFTFTTSHKTEFICIMLWLFITGSRASELLDSASSRGLHLEEIRFVNEATGATHPFSSLQWEGPAVLHISRSKTDQRSEGLIKSVPNVQGSDLCPMSWARSYFESLVVESQQGLGQSRLFFSLDYNGFSKIFQEIMISLGEDCTPHGTKSGATTQLASLGVEDEAISRQLMWKAKSMVSHYSHHSLQESLRLQRAMLTEASPILLKPLRSAFQL